MRFDSLILDRARKALQKEALERTLEVCKIVPAMLEESTGDIAALCVAMDAVRIMTPA